MYMAHVHLPTNWRQTMARHSGPSVRGGLRAWNCVAAAHSSTSDASSEKRASSAHT